MNNTMSREEYIKLGKQFRGKCIIRKWNGYCCMKVNDVSIYHNNNDVARPYIKLSGCGYEVRNESGIKSKWISNGCYVYLLNPSDFENLEIISEERFTGLMKDVIDEIMGHSVESDVNKKMIYGK